MTFAEWLAKNNYDAEALTPAMKKHLEAAWKAEAEPATPPAPPAAQQPAASPDTQGLDDVLAAARREQARVARITELVASTITERPASIGVAEAIGRAAIEGKWDTTRAELELLRAGRGNGTPMVLTGRGKPEVTDHVLEAAVCVHGRLDNLEKSFNERTLEAAHQHFRGGLGLMDLISHCAARNGVRVHNAKANYMPLLRAAFRGGRDDGYSPRADVGPSTHDISGILSNTANKFLRTAFLNVEDSWRQVTAVRPVTDFKTITSYSLTGDNTYEKVAPGGEIKHGSLGELSYTNRADTYAKLLGVDRRDLINDDLGALTGAGRRLGRGGALKLNDVFWTAFMADASTFYTSARGNYDDGASDTLMDLTGLANARKLFITQTDPDSKPLGVIPKIILVPPQLYPSAWTLLMSTTLNLATATAASTGTASPWTGMFRLVESTYLANSSYTGYSVAAWYMLADPQDLPVIETCFLNGQEMPTIESADLDFDRLGIALRGYYDFGVTKQEYRAAVKMKGEA